MSRMKFIPVMSSLILWIGMLGCDSASVQSSPTAHGDSLGREIPPWVKNDADLLVFRCGEPDKVIDTSHDDPRPLIPSRLITYRKAHLRIL